MYQTMWIDISSGMERLLLDIVVKKVRQFKETEGFPHAEVGLVFEEFDIYAIFELEDNDLLLDFILREIATLEGVAEIRMGQLCKVSAPLRPFRGKAVPRVPPDAMEARESILSRGESYFLIYLDAIPIQYPKIFDALEQLNDQNIRFFAYCMDSYEEDLVVCLAMEGFEEAKYHIVSTLRNIEGMRDTRSYAVNNVVFL